MHSLGRHALVDLYGCDPETLKDTAYIQKLLHDTAVELKCTIVEETFHTFSPWGVSGVIVIAESHLSIHTWPEYGYAALDLFTCSQTTELARLAGLLEEGFGATEVEYREEARGRLPLRVAPAVAGVA
ncbi:MAG: adenosylmethionine decarboxylase [Deltaproteobacteria bacterium]|nr:MAG: adenosylmethionine decarboxylase [Deltaproteobacteria bacterium]